MDLAAQVPAAQKAAVQHLHQAAAGCAAQLVILAVEHFENAGFALQHKVGVIGAGEMADRPALRGGILARRIPGPGDGGGGAVRPEQQVLPGLPGRVRLDDGAQGKGPARPQNMPLAAAEGVFDAGQGRAALRLGRRVQAAALDDNFQSDPSFPYTS